MKAIKIINRLYKQTKVVIVFVLLLNTTLFGQTTYYSRAGQADPNNLSNWTLNSDGTGANPVNFTADNLTFIIQSGHSYTTTAAWNITGASTLQVNGTLTLSHVLTLGTASTKIGNLTVNGTVNANTQNVIANTSGVFTINSGGLYKLNHTTPSNGNTSFNGTETFNSGSTFEYANLTSGGLVNAISYHHLVFSGATATFPSTITIGGDMTVSAGSVTVDQNRMISGNLTVSGGTLTIASNGARTLTVNGNVTISGGTLDMSSSGFGSDNGTLSIKGNFTHTSGTITETGSSTASTIAITGTTAQTIESTGRSNTVLFSVAQTTATGTCSIAASKTFVNQGSTFIVTDNTSTLSDFTINGTFTRAGSSPVTFVGLTVANGGTYEHATTGGSAIPTATWSDGSLLLVSNAPDLSGMPQSFWNLTYNNASASTEIINDGSFEVRNILSLPSTNNGTFTLVSTSSNRTNSIATLNVAGGTFNMATSSGTSGLTGAVNVSGGTFNMATNTGAPTITGNVAVSGGTFNMTSAASTPGAPTITGNVTVSGGVFYAVTSTVNASATATIAGNLSVSGGTFYVTGNNNLDVHILDLNGTLDLSSSGVIEFNPVSAGTGAGRLYVSGNVSISGGTMQRTQTVTDGSTGIYFDGSTQTFTWSGGSISNAMPNRFYVNGVTTLNEVYSHGSSAQTTVNGTAGTPAVGSSAWPTSINNLTINNTSGVTLSAAKTVGGTLTFTNGILTPNGNTLTISNTSTSAISGAGAGKYVSGPLRWNLSNSNGTYLFPVGKGGNYYPFTLATTAASSPVITVESFNADAGGTNGATISASSTTEYWSATLNSGTFTGNLSLTRPSAITAFDVIAQSATQTGTYASIGGTLSSPSVNNSNALSSLGFFKFATSASCADPTTQADGITFTSVGATGMTVNWSGSGNGDGVIVIMKAGSDPTDPSDNTSYTANTAFGSGTDVGSSSFVVFNGSGSSVNVTGLSPSTNYFIKVFSKNCSGTNIKINTVSPANSSQFTLATELSAHPASFSCSATIGNQIDLSYSAVNTITNAYGFIILQKNGATAPTSIPADGTAYSIGSNIGDGIVADIITNTSQTISAISNLSVSTQYSYSIIPYSYDGLNSATYNYYTIATIKNTTCTTTSCANPTSGGVITGNQSNCGSFDPTTITSVSIPSGNSGTIEYKWQQSIISSSSGFSDIASTNSSDYNPGTITQTTWYKRISRVTCTDWIGAAESNVIECIVVSSTQITGTPVSDTVYNQLGNASFGVSVVPLTGSLYQWQFSADDGSSWSNVSNSTLYSGSTNSILQITNPTYSMNGYLYRCLVSNSTCGNVTSSAGTLRVLELTVFSNTTSTSCGTNLNNDFSFQRTIAVSGLPSTLGTSSGQYVLREVRIKLGNSTCKGNLETYSARLKSPIGTTINLFNDFTVSSTNMWADIKYRDHVSLERVKDYQASVQSGYFPYKIGYYAPETDNTFDDFNGQDPNGNWILELAENTSTEVSFERVDLIYGPPFVIIDLTSSTSNNNCSSSSCISSQEIIIASNNGYSGNDSNYPGSPVGGCSWNGANNNSAWFKFTASSSTSRITISGLNGGGSNDQQPIIVKAPTSCSSPSIVPTGGCPDDESINNSSYLSSNGGGTSSGNVYFNGITANVEFNLSSLVADDDYYIYIDGNGGTSSSFYIELESGAQTCRTLLPVELSLFKAIYKFPFANLKWRTESELNNDRFEIEKSTDGVNWKFISSIKGKGTTSVANDYEFTDENIIDRITYYRLKQIDFDGKFSYSSIETVIPSDNSNILFYPNPATNEIVIANVSDKEFSYQLIDQLGRVVLKGKNRASSNIISIEQLDAGVYVLIVNDTCYGKLIKR